MGSNFSLTGVGGACELTSAFQIRIAASLASPHFCSPISSRRSAEPGQRNRGEPVRRRSRPGSTCEAAFAQRTRRAPLFLNRTTFPVVLGVFSTLVLLHRFPLPKLKMENDDKYLPELLAEKDSLDVSFTHAMKLLNAGKAGFCAGNPFEQPLHGCGRDRGSPTKRNMSDTVQVSH